MAGCEDAELYQLVHDRGGPGMLAAALFGSIPWQAQWVLRKVLVQISHLLFGRVRCSIIFRVVRHLLRPLFENPSLKPASVKTACSGCEISSSANTMLDALSSAVALCLSVKKIVGVEDFSPIHDGEDPLSYLLHVVGSTNAAWLASIPRNVAPCHPALSRSTTRPSRVYEALFSTTTTLALRTYLRHFITRTPSSSITVFVPGLLTAPWPGLLISSLLEVIARYDVTVLGYDVQAEKGLYVADLSHLCSLDSRKHSRSSDPPPLSTSPALADSTCLLMLASIRGLPVHNAGEACMLAKQRGWQVLELRIPTLPPNIVGTLGPTSAPLWVRERRERCAASPVRPDMRITVFDDVGMHGGAVVEICCDDTALVALMKSTCQPGLPERNAAAASLEGALTPVSPALAAKTKVSVLAAATATASDFAGAYSELLTKVWGPWTRQLCKTTWREMSFIRESSVVARQTWTTLRHVSRGAQWDLSRFAPSRLRQVSVKPAVASGIPVNENNGNRISASVHVTSDTPVEERTTVIAGPLDSFSLRNATSAGKDAASGRKRKMQSLRSPDAQELRKAVERVAEGNAPTHIPMEWRIRLQWSWLLMTTVVPPTNNGGNSCETAAVCASAAYVSLWSFVLQLPPWIVAVSVGNDGLTSDGQPCSSCCVEVAATALLLRLKDPATPRSVAHQLREQAHVEAAAVRVRPWESLAPSTGVEMAAKFAFMEAVIFPGCVAAAQLADELLFLPLSPALPVNVRAAVLRVLWDQGPPAIAESCTSSQDGESPRGETSSIVHATLQAIYRTYVDQARRSAPRTRTPRSNAVLGDHASRTTSCTDAISVQEAEITQQLLFDRSSAILSRAPWGEATRGGLRSLLPALLSKL